MAFAASIAQTTKEKIAIGVRYFNQDDLLQATKYFKDLYKQVPAHSVVNYWLGGCYEREDDKRKAAVLYLAAYKLSKYAAPDILYRVGRAYQLKSMPDEALKHYKLYLGQLDSARATQMGSTLAYELKKTDKMMK